MHQTALMNFQHFLDAYLSAVSSPTRRIRLVEVGSLDVNGSLRSVVSTEMEYIGVDFEAGQGVDIVVEDPYVLPFDDHYADLVVSSSCFEHSEFFWLLFLEILRISKPTALFYLNAPSNGAFHRYPVDCWRFYPDSGAALVAWAKRNRINACLLESYTSRQVGDQWNDFVAVFLKDAQFVSRYPRRILDHKTDITNGRRFGSDEIIQYSSMPEDKLSHRSH